MRVLSWRTVLLVSLVWAALVYYLGWLRWATFQLGTFDLAFYEQALVCGVGLERLSLLGVPLLGNHFDAIVWGFLPAYWVWPSPLVLIAGQALILSGLLPIGRAYALTCGFDGRVSFWLAVSLLLTPATVYAGLHEFHPEALGAVFLLLLLLGRLRRSLPIYWMGFILVWTSKENLMLVIGFLALADLWMLRRDRAYERILWVWLPGGLSVIWLFLWIFVLSPAWNAGTVHFGSLYEHLWRGADGPDEVMWRIMLACAEGLVSPLLLGTLFSFAGMALLRPAYLFAALPLLLQHFLSFREVERMLHPHYAVPLIPLFWVGAVEALRGRPLFRRWWPVVPAATLVVLSFSGLPGHIGAIMERAGNDPALIEARREAVETVDRTRSVMAGFGMQAALSGRRALHSLHFVLKGLETLGPERYCPPDGVDVVIVDYSDSATFDARAGFLHPRMRTGDGRVIPSSANLLHGFLASSDWAVTAREEVIVLRRGSEPFSSDLSGTEDDHSGETLISPGYRLDGVTVAESGNGRLALRVGGSVDAGRTVHPWMEAVFVDHDGVARARRVRGWLAIGKAEGSFEEEWEFSLPVDLPPGEYRVMAVFRDLDLELGGKGYLESVLASIPCLDVRVGP